MNADAPALPAGEPDDPAAVLDAMAVGFLTLDRDGTVTGANESAGVVLGRSAGEIVGRNLWDEFPGAREREFGQACETALRTGRTAWFEAWYPKVASWYQLRVVPTERGLSCFVLDVTARREAEEMAARAAQRAEVTEAVSRALAGSLDVVENIAGLARLVVPYLGDVCIVSVVSEDGTLTDVGSWHVDPDQRGLAAELSRLRLAAFGDESLGVRAVRTGEATVVTQDTTATIHAAMLPGRARDLIDHFAPTQCALLPMVTDDRAVGLLTVYSDAVWTADQRAVADDVVTRAALAVDNSLAYARVQEARKHAETANERLTLLARVGTALAETEDADAAVGELARLVVPELADWSLVTLVQEDGTLYDAGRAHRDPERFADLVAYADRHLSAMSDAAAIATALRTGQPVVVPHLDLSTLADFIPDPEVFELTRRVDPYGVAAFPLTASGRTFGVLTLATTSARGGHRDDELATALEVARRAAPVLAAATAAARARELAGRIQRNLLHVMAPSPGLETVVRYRPAYDDRELGGDWYDVFPLPDGGTSVTIGDIVGHDLSAMAAMAQVRTLMRANAWTLRHSPSQILAATEQVSSALGPGELASAFVAEFAPAGPGRQVRMTWSNAGHPPPVVLRSGGDAELLEADTHDPLLCALRRSPQRRDFVTILGPGDTLLLYTDGLVERRDESLDDGIGRLLATLAAQPADAGPEALCDGVLGGMLGTERQADDVALLAVRVGS